MEEQTWDTNKMRECRNEWSLAADTQLLNCMQRFSQKLLSETHSTLKALDLLESEVVTTCVQVSNIGNQFWALSDTQFVENRVYDDDDIISPISSVTSQDNLNKSSENLVIQRLSEAINNGIKVLDSKFETVQIVSSDSEEEGDDSSPHSGVLLKPVNRYKDRLLPHLIGSAEFHSDQTLGLRDLPSDEETDEFMSASDKAYDESEDSDIESDQTKVQDILDDKENSNYRPLDLGLLRGQSQSVVRASNSYHPSGDEPDDDQKRIYSRWQPSDLWAPEDEVQKVLDKNTGSYRPPSADSSVSSVPSSNVSEPVKKTSEDFGKSGSGRLPVCVQEDQDLFSGGGSAANAQLSESKKFVPAGGVKIFEADINLFPERRIQTKNVPNEGLFSSSIHQDRWESGADSEIFATAQKSSDTVVPKDPPPSISRERNVDLFNNDESEDDLFSDKVKRVEPIENSKSDFLNSKIVKTSVNLPEKSQLLSAMSKDSSISVSKSDPFIDVKNQVQEEDNLFSSKGLFTRTEYGHSPNLFYDDLFSSDRDGIFSNHRTSIPQSRETISSTDSLFSSNSSNSKPLSSSENNKKINKPQNAFEKDLFPDEGDLFGDIYSGDDDLFRKLPIPKKNTSSPKIQEQNSILAMSKSVSKNIFNDDDTEDLFSDSVNRSSSVNKNVVNDDSLFSDKHSSALINEKTINRSDVLLSKNSVTSTKATKLYNIIDDDDLFISNKQPEAKGPVQKSKDEQTDLKQRKHVNRQNLFESDSDEDLFSSPQGSLSSRKSLQTVTASLESKDYVDKKQGSLLSNNEQNSSKILNTDFSKIFADNFSEKGNYIISDKISTGKKSSDIFREDKALFFNPVDELNTPELFINSSSISSFKEQSGMDNASFLSQQNLNEVISDEMSPVNEAVDSKHMKSLPNQNIIAEHEEPISNKADLFDDSPLNEEVQRSHKPTPPKSLDIRPTISESLSSNSAPLVEKVEKPSLVKKPIPKVLHDDTETKDVVDGEMLIPPSPSKALPGKLKASQLININTAALLPGAKQQVNKDQPLGNPVEAIVASDAHNSDLIPVTKSPPSIERSSVSVVMGSKHVMTGSTSSFINNITKQEEDMPAKSSLLQSVNKERAKIQGKRRPSSRRARQQAIRASSTEADSENSVFPPAATTNLMSPSTDEEDLFSVPDVKTTSPTCDIFGTPTVLSPIIRQEPPSSFVSPPFVHSQPPPLDEEDEQMSNQEDDMFESQNMFDSLLQSKQTPEVNTNSEVQRKQEISEDIFGISEEKSLFSDIREAPPPLIDDEDNNEDDNDLFVSSIKTKKSFNSFRNPSLTTLETSDSILDSNSLFPKTFPSLKTVGSVSLKNPNKSDDTDECLFPTDHGAKAISSDSMFFETVIQKKTEEYSFDSSIKIPDNSDALFPTSLFEQVPSGGFLKSSSNNPPKIKTDSSVTSQSIKSSKDGDSFFTGSVKPIMEPTENAIFVTSRKEESEEALFGSNSKPKKEISDVALFQSSENIKMDSTDDALLTSSKSSTNETLYEPLKSKSMKSIVKDQSALENKTHFEGEDSSGNLFGSEKKVRTVMPVKTSLFGDEDDDSDDIFGSSTLSIKNEQSIRISTTLNTPSNLGSSQRGTKPGSSKPVKLEAKQAFSDPLFSNK